uniref:SRCR domain-containing protein n=1 Tax=Terrapene triunguis TaxID=2587831 RepID=A0A674K899_9SAUR
SQGEESTKEGRVEVFLNGQWGSVCDDGWTDKDAVVVCRQLGYSGAAKARTMAYFGEGHGPIHLDNVECSGTERTLGECVKPDNGIHNCWHSEDAGVSCDYMEEKAQDTRNAGAPAPSPEESPAGRGRAAQRGGKWGNLPQALDPAGAPTRVFGGSSAALTASAAIPLVSVPSVRNVAWSHCALPTASTAAPPHIVPLSLQEI